MIATLLVVRRLLAGIIDITILTMPLAAAMWALVVREQEWGALWTALWLWTVVGYYTIYHYACGGRTPGKLLFHLRVVGREQAGATLYECARRIAIVVTAPVALSVAVQLLPGQSLSGDVLNNLRLVLLTGVVVVWPLSIVFTGGRSSLHDAFSRTFVISEGERSSLGLESMRPRSWMAIGGALTVGIIVASLDLTFFRPLPGADWETGKDDLRNYYTYFQWDRIREALGDAESGLLTGDAGFGRAPWTTRGSPEYTFHKMAIEIPSGLRDGRESVPGAPLEEQLIYSIELRRSAFMSQWTQFHLARWIASDVLRRTGSEPSRAFVFQFVWRARVPLLDVMLQRNVVVVESEEEGEFLLLEPDQWARAGLGFHISTKPF